jgi:hypothetical protein
MNIRSTTNAAIPKANRTKAAPLACRPTANQCVTAGNDLKDKPLTTDLSISTRNAGLLRGMPPPARICIVAGWGSIPVDTPKKALLLRTAISSIPNYTPTVDLLRDDTLCLSGLDVQSIHRDMHQSRRSGLCCFSFSPCLACSANSLLFRPIGHAKRRTILLALTDHRSTAMPQENIRINAYSPTMAG